MYIINPRLTGNILNSDGYNNLLSDIDNTIATLAESQYRNDTLGFTECIDMKLYDKLCDYREILLDKLMGCNCLEEEYTIYITSRIQKLIC